MVRQRILNKNLIPDEPGAGAMRTLPHSTRPILAFAVLTTVVSFHAQASAAPLPESQEEILAHIDSLHAVRQVEETRDYIEPHLVEARAACCSGPGEN